MFLENIKNITTKYLVLILALFIFMNSIYASSLYIDSLLVNTDSTNSYLNVQYGNYYDNVNLKVAFQLNNIPSYLDYVPLVLSPKIYGVNPNGQITLVDVLPSSYYDLYNTNVQEYMFNNMFYIYPDYSAYLVNFNVRSLDNQFSIDDVAYIYTDQTIYLPDDILLPPNSQNDSSQDSQDDSGVIEDYYLSGMQDIYLDEDEEDSYILYIQNEYNEELEIISITTNQPTRLDVEGIDYESFIASGSQKRAYIDLQADTVSNDYSGELEINVIGRFDNGADIEKQYLVTYYIADEDSQNTGDCSDIDFEDTSFSLNDNTIDLKNIKIINNSNDYDFEIESIEIEEDNYIRSEILEYPEDILEEDFGLIEIEFDVEDITYNLTRNIDLEIEGVLTRIGRDDKSCNISKNLRISLKDMYDPDSQTTNNTSECSKLTIFTTPILQKEGTIKNYNKESGFYIYNSSNKKFNINNINIQDNSSFAQISSINIDPAVYANSNLPIVFDLQSDSVNYSSTSNAKIGISGQFSDGTICNSSDLYKYFEIGIFTEDDKCANVGVNNKIINAGEDSFSIFNNTDDEFYVEDILVSNRNGLQINIPQKSNIINNNSSKDISAYFSGIGSLQLDVLGRFEDGTNCSLVSTQAGTITSYNSYNNDGIDFSDNTCQVQFLAPTTFELINNTEQLDISIINLSTKSGKIKIVGNGVVVNPSVIYLDGEDNFTQNLVLSNYDNPRSIFYNIQLNSCDDQIYFTDLLTTNIPNRISFLSYPTIIKPDKVDVLVQIILENSFNESQNLDLKLNGFPSSWESSIQNISIPSRSEGSFNINLNIDSKDLDSNNVYNGFIEIYKNNYKINSKPLTIDLRSEIEDVVVDYNFNISSTSNQTFILDVYFKNNTFQTKDLVIDFNLDSNDFIIEGENNISLLPDSNLSKTYRIQSLKELEDIEVSSFDVLVKDADTNNLIVTKNIDFADKISSPNVLTGFFIFSSTFNFIIFIIILLVIIFILILKIKKYKCKKKVITTASYVNAIDRRKDL